MSSNSWFGRFLLLAISKIYIVKVAHDDHLKNTPTTANTDANVALSIAIDMKHLDLLTCCCVDSSDVGTMYVRQQRP